MANERNIGLFFKVSEHEHDLIKQKMALLGTKNQSAYLRKMVIDGYVIRLELEQFQEMLSLMRRTSNNVNQIAHQMHIYGLEAVKQQCFSIISEVSRIITQVKNNSHDSED